MKWVVAYDISSDRRRRRLARRLERFGFRLQKSVFEGEASPAELKALFQELEEFVHPQTDVLMAWPMTERGAACVQHCGRPPEDTHRDWMVI